MNLQSVGLGEHGREEIAEAIVWALLGDDADRVVN